MIPVKPSRVAARVATPLLFGVLLASSSPLQAETAISGTISASATWSLAGSPFVVTGDVFVQGPASPILTINAGVTVRFNAGGRLMVGKSAAGKLVAAGTASLPITFTANAAAPTAGYWRGIGFYSLAAAGSKIAFATVEYGGYAVGYGGDFGGILVSGSSPVLQSVTVRNCVVAGIIVTGGAPSITGSTLTANPVGLSVSYPGTPSLQSTTLSNNAGFAVSVDPQVTLGTLSGLVFSGNGADAIRIAGGTVSVNTTWKNGGAPYVVKGSINVESSGGVPTLTIQAGVTLEFDSNTALIIGRSYAGGLHAVGTSSQRITFTTSSSSPAPGNWRGIEFNSHMTPSSKISYADIDYGGFNDGVGDFWGGITINAAAPTLQNVTVQNCAMAGIWVLAGSAPDISGSRLSGNPVGLYVLHPSVPSLQKTEISGNSGYAISIDARVSFDALSGLTVSGNGVNAIDVRNGTIDRNTTWKNGGIPYVTRGSLYVEGPASPVFTVEPGSVLKFAAGAIVSVGRGSGGSLTAVGTPSQRITFTASASSPVPGSWLGVRLYGKTTSTIAYATVRYGGQSDPTNGFKGGVHAESGNPVLDHVGFDTNAYAGVSTSLAAPTIKNCDFMNNPAGLKNQTPGTLVAADLNWWSSASGPSGSGPGTGQSVSSSVRFEPWLTAAASAPQFVKTLTVKNSTFNPSVGINAALVFTSASSGSWKVTFSNSGGVVRTIIASGAGVTLTWDGKDASGTSQPGGSYTYSLETASGVAATPVSGRLIIDLARQLALTGVAAAPAFFSPNADGIQDFTTLTAASSFDGAAWTVNVRNPAGTIVRTVTGAADPAISFSWDGRNGGGALQPDGSYTLELTVTDGGQSVSASPPVTLDTILPSVGISSPAGGALLSNIHQNGDANVDVSGTGTDVNFKSWLLDYAVGSAPASWTQISSGTSAATNAKLATWPTLGRNNGAHTLRLQVFDLAGNVGAVTKTLTIGNFTMKQSADQFNGAGGSTVTYVSFVPFALTEVVTMRNLAGETVRTLFSGQRTAGTFTDVFNGRDSQGRLLPDGPYFYSATATAAPDSMTWDLGGQFTTGNTPGFLCQAWLPTSSFQPFNNRLLPISYSLGSPSRVWLLFTPGGFDCNTPGPARSLCSLPDNFCSPSGAYEESGTHTSWWAGVDPAGVFHENIGSIALLRSDGTFPQNAAVLFGTRPSLANLTVQPPNYNPSTGPQTIALDVSSYQSQPVSVSIAVFNQEAQSVLRTVTAIGQAAGRLTIPWDGRADNGMWVAPGAYTLTVSVSDGIGNTVSRQTLTTINY